LGKAARNNTNPTDHAQGAPSVATSGGSAALGSRENSQIGPFFLSKDQDDEPSQPIPCPQLPQNAPLFIDEIPEELLEKIPELALPPPNIDPMDIYVARVLEIIPDVQPTHVLSLLEKHVEEQHGDVVGVVLHTLFEDPTYPRIDKKGKRKREEIDDEGDGAARAEAKVKIDYANKDRVNRAGPLYTDISLVGLYRIKTLRTYFSSLLVTGTTAR
jgi:TRIAD3 protein (E3 ubiquitin-protein ligase RNF216)